MFELDSIFQFDNSEFMGKVIAVVNEFEMNAFESMIKCISTTQIEKFEAEVLGLLLGEEREALPPMKEWGAIVARYALPSKKRAMHAMVSSIVEDAELMQISMCSLGFYIAAAAYCAVKNRVKPTHLSQVMVYLKFLLHALQKTSSENCYFIGT